MTATEHDSIVCRLSRFNGVFKVGKGGISNIFINDVHFNQKNQTLNKIHNQ